MINVKKLNVEQEIKDRMKDLTDEYLKLDRFKDVHQLDMVEGEMKGLKFAINILKGGKR